MSTSTVEYAERIERLEALAGYLRVAEAQASELGLERRGGPVKATKRVIGGILSAAILAGMGSQFLSQNVFTYGSAATANQGVFVTIPFSSHWCGVETRGSQGFFCDSD